MIIWPSTTPLLAMHGTVCSRPPRRGSAPVTELSLRKWPARRTAFECPNAPITECGCMRKLLTKLNAMVRTNKSWENLA
jgi:hypothetical protein